MIILYDMIDNPADLSKFRRIYDRYKNTMYSVAIDISKNVHDAEDIVEISLIKVIEILDKINVDDIDKPKCKNLMITIAKNSAIDYGRKGSNKENPCEYIEDYRHVKDVQELYIDMENYREVVACLQALDDKYKDILQMKILYDLSSKEIGKLLGIAEHNVNMRYMRAKAMLQQKLEERRKDG